MAWRGNFFVSSARWTVAGSGTLVNICEALAAELLLMSLIVILCDIVMLVTRKNFRACFLSCLRGRIRKIGGKRT